MEEEVKDIYNNKNKYLNWKKEVSEFGIDGISKKSSDLIIKHVVDMEEGKNVAKGSKKGARSFTRLNSIRIRLIFTAKLLEQRGLKSLDKLDVNLATDLFNDMRTGRLRKADGGIYKSTADYVKIMKSFWNWFIKINKKEQKIVENITEDLDTSRDENNFVFFDKEELDKLLPYFSIDEQVRLLFMFDTIIRSPTELVNVKVSDLKFNEKENIVSIREETSKTFGRTIKLLLCSEELKKYIGRNNLNDNDFLFNFSTPIFNKKLKRVAKEIFGDKMTKGGKKYSQLTMYDFRHSGACHWRTGAYKTKIDALMYRGGWNNLTRLNYYTKKIGMKDTIEKDDLLVNIDKHQLEKEMDKLKEVNEKLQKENELSKKKFKTFESQMKQMQELTLELTQKVRKI